MMPFRLFIRPLIIVCLLLGLVCSLPANAKNGGGKAATPPPVDPRILVTAVDAGSKQITVTSKRNGQTTEYAIDGLTQITYQNNPGSFSDIKVGQQVFASVERDAHTLDSITVGAADPAPEAPATGKGKGKK